VVDIKNGVWEDWLGLQDAPTTLVEPHSLPELIQYLRHCNPLRQRMRATGAGHSTSDVARPFRRQHQQKHAGASISVQKVGLAWNGIDRTWWRDGVGDHLARVEAGATIQNLNHRFFQQGLAFPNLGSYDQQTIYGAIATGTHGTGMVSPPLADLVVSIELLTYLPDQAGRPTLRHLRIEPAVAGPTDPARFAAAKELHGMDLLPDSDAFYSATVGLGYFGIVTALTLQLAPAFWLDETQTLERWEDLRRDLPRRAERAQWFDFLLSTRKTLSGPGGMGYKCLTSTRKKISGSGWGQPRDDERRKRLLAPKMPPDRDARTKMLANLYSNHPKLANRTATEVFEIEAAHAFQSASHHVLRTSVGDLLYATSCEVSVPMNDVMAAMDAIIANNAKNDQVGLNHTSPFGVRFSLPSQHYMAMAYGRATCTIEAPLLLYTRATSGKYEGMSSEGVISEIFGRFQAALRAACPDARFHFGQRNSITRADLEAYPEFETWRRQYRRFNAFQTFSNAASARWRLDA
jgi:hypothetical protein